jgi:putative DNA primase/helicase
MYSPKPEIGPAPQIEGAWFNAVAGRDEWRDVRTIVTLGQAYPQPNEIERMAGALSGAAPMTVAEWHAANPPPRDARRSGKADSWYPSFSVKRRVRQDGQEVDVDGVADLHPDPLCEIMRYRICEGEVLQALGRGRGVNRTADRPLDLVVLGTSVLPVPVDELLSEEDVDVSPFDRMLAAGGVAFESPTDAYWAYKADPEDPAALDMWPSPDAARMDMARERANKRTNPYREFLIRGCSLVPVTYQREGPKQRRKRAVVMGSAAGARGRLEAFVGPLAFFEIVGQAAEPVVELAVAPTVDPKPEPAVGVTVLRLRDERLVHLEYVTVDGRRVYIRNSVVTRRPLSGRARDVAFVAARSRLTIIARRGVYMRPRRLARAAAA